MKCLHVTVVLLVFLSGCSFFDKMKHRNADAALSKSKDPSPMSQLGAALPAMKAGGERELKLIAAKQMTEHGYWTEAVELYREAEAMAPKKPKLDAQLAPALAGAGQFPESLQRYRRLMEVSPKDAALINNYAFTLMESGDFVSAEVEFRRVITIDPSYQNATVNLGLLLARQRRYDEALAVLAPAIGEAAAHHNLGVIAIDIGDEATAKTHFAIASNMPGAPKASQAFASAL